MKFEITTKIVNRLMPLYMEGHRHYHGIEHIETSLDWLLAPEDYFGFLSDDDSAKVETMIWFHDAVYATGDCIPHGENERLSANLFAGMYSERGEDFTEIYDGIIRSAYHTQYVPDSLTAAQKAFLDIDLLGLSVEDYTDFIFHGEAIRREYAHVPYEIFVAGRAAFFHEMLKRPFIYYTPEIRVWAEERARRNITIWLKNNTLNK